ncbi:MAG TPA: hypothetical protein VJB87_03700 [Candidatus Nanoarchaeia archaeon]|nr:hypothetical protein [Candidatus Nanoarchaeia archaeon]
MKEKKDLTLPVLYRLGLLGSIFILLALLKQQFINYQAIEAQYIQLIQSLGTAALQNAEGIAATQTLFNQFNSLINHYTTIFFLLLSSILIAYLFWEYFTWKNILQTPHTTYWWRFLLHHLISLIIIIAVFYYLWDKITFSDYTFSKALLWFPIITYLLHILQTISYATIDQASWMKNSWKKLFSTSWRILFISLGSYALIIFIITGIMYLVTHYTQGITDISLYIWCILTLGLTLFSVYYNSVTLHWLRHHLSIKK